MPPSAATQLPSLTHSLQLHCLQQNPGIRLGVEEALQHEWLRVAPTALLDTALQVNLRHFSRKTKLERYARDRCPTNTLYIAAPCTEPTSIGRDLSGRGRLEAPSMYIRRVSCKHCRQAPGASSDLTSQPQHTTHQNSACTQLTSQLHEAERRERGARAAWRRFCSRGPCCRARRSRSTTPTRPSASPTSET
jgi:hypothetical protein